MMWPSGYYRWGGESCFFPPPTIARGIIAAHDRKIDNSNADANAADDVDRSLDDAASSELSCRLKRSWEDERPTTSRNSPAA